MPKISVVIPTYNAAKYLQESIDSILNQTYQDFEILVIYGYSTDNTLQILNSYNDSRIHIINGEQKGISAALNLGVSKAKGEFIARMDADDIARTDRFEKQIALLNSNPQISLCGSWMKHSDRALSIYETSPKDIKTSLLFWVQMGHPTVMWRKADFDKFKLKYDQTLLGAEDFDLWKRATEYLQFSNIPEYLVEYRVHAVQGTKTKFSHDRVAVGQMIARDLKKHFDFDFPDKFVYFFRNEDDRYSYEDILTLDNLMVVLQNKIETNNEYNNVISREMISKSLINAIITSLNIIQIIHIIPKINFFSKKQFLRYYIHTYMRIIVSKYMPTSFFNLLRKLAKKIRNYPLIN